MLTQRKKKIFKRVVEEYIKIARPVSSRTLARMGFSNLSSATLRNEMLDLTRKGLLLQPYTSAGKIPTLTGFKYFLENFLEKKQLSHSEKNILDNVKEGFSMKKTRMKEVAKKMAEISEEAVIVAFSKDDFYYTGFSYLFRQPEFKNLSLVHDISEIIDHLDETMKNIFDKIDKTEVWVGDENPFGDQCAVIFDKLEIDGQKIVFGILGPIRMNYGKNLSLIKFVKEII